MSSTTITPALQKALIGCAGAAVAVAILKFLYPAQKRIQWAENVRTTISDHLFHEDESHQSVGAHEPPLTPVASGPKASVEKLTHKNGYNAKLIEERKKVYEAIKDLPRLPELDYVPTAKYVEMSKEDVLHPLIETASVILVPGAYFGDEGKGKTVDAIARHPSVKVVARVNSGENAGHTVFSDDGHKYAFHLCPSGLLTPGKVNVIGPECVMDPVSFMEREVKQLIDTGVA